MTLPRAPPLLLTIRSGQPADVYYVVRPSFFCHTHIAYLWHLSSRPSIDVLTPPPLPCGHKYTIAQNTTGLPAVPSPASRLPTDSDSRKPCISPLPSTFESQSIHTLLCHVNTLPSAYEGSKQVHPAAACLLAT